MDEVEIEYLAENDHERSLLTVLSLSVGKEGAKALLPFSMLAQAVYAGESSDDPSFASNLAKMARNALLDEQYIDA